ncbi:virulence-associated E family protein [Mitsuokella multacida]|uniref:virulence-associated E family protein n=1 Tax=Mitsuokella multacida TaxID=52226 RepID=UPI0026668FBC|nr:virulence-associated E family protein [Mitsuokella multacida]
MNDTLFYIAVAPSRQSTSWRNVKTSWQDFLQDHLLTPCRTNETMAEYAAMKKPERDRVKDQGGFVGGYLEGGRRKKESVKLRQLICLDADNIPKGVDFPAMVAEKGGVPCYAIYPTHSATPDKPRYRLVIPCSRPLAPEAYEPAARIIAQRIGINYFDPTTYEASRLMYWPTCPKDAPYQCLHFESPDGAWANPDALLEEYEDWRDASAWPIGKTETQAHARTIKRLGDPREKQGVVGAFCKAYTITEAIAKFLPDTYTKVDGTEDRYTYAYGTTTGGVIIYDDDLHAYSHHATDPISGMDVNAFDLVRLNKFAQLDENVGEKTPINKYPSYTAMSEFARKDEKVKGILVDMALADFDDNLIEDTGDVGEDEVRKDDDQAIRAARLALCQRLDWTAKGTRILATAKNFLLILNLDPELKGIAALDHFSHRIVMRRDTPWRKLRAGANPVWTDADDAQLRNFIGTHYGGLASKALIDDAFTEVTSKNAFHQVKEWWQTLVWDGVPRVGRLLIDYLGAEDNAYTREVTETFFKAGVARVMRPGTKFDCCLVLTGPQGIGKSTILARMGGRWFNDSIVSIKGKDPLEQLIGSLIIELGEMQAATRAENDELKAFISRQTDKFRAPYGRRTEEYPRQCIFAATTNDDIFLKDRTGGRRFLIVPCAGNAARDLWQEFTPEEAAQCWAECIALYRKNPNLELSKESRDAAREMQESHTEGAELSGLVEAYLNRALPQLWDSMGLEERREWLDSPAIDAQDEGYVKRERVCTLEIWCECLGNSQKSMRNLDARNLNTIMQHMPGWETYRGDKGGRLRFPLYGTQRAYVRKGSLLCVSGKDKISKDTTDEAVNRTVNDLM